VADNVWIFDSCKKIAITWFSYKCYTNGQKMNIYTLTIYIIHGPFDYVTLSYDLWLDVGCNFTYATKAILVVNVGYNYFIVTNWSHKLTFFF